MKNRIIIPCICGLMACCMSSYTASAQVSKQVEVTKAYVPEVSEAVKLPIVPNMVDTVKMHPDIDYRITPLMYSTDLATHQFKPATVTYWEFNRPSAFYVKVGAGYPLNSIADVYASTYNAREGYVMAYVNHQGQYSDIRNYQGIKTDAVQMQTRVGAAGGVFWGKRMFEGDVWYQTDMYSRYADTGLGVDFEDVNLKMRLGDDFVDLSRLNFNIEVRGSYFHDKSKWGDLKPNIQQADFGAMSKLARKFGRHYIEMDLGYDGYWGIKDYSDYTDHVARAGLHYAYTSDFLELAIGADYYYDHIATTFKKSHHYVIPHARIQLNVSNRGVITPYVELDGALQNNSYYSLVKRNPYVDFFDPALRTLPNTVNYNLDFGVDGHFAQDKFSYRLYFNMNFIENSLYWYNYDIMWIRAENARQNIMSLNLEFEYKPVNQFILAAGVHGFIYTDFANICNGRSPVEAYIKARYMFGKFSIGVSADFCGVSKWSSFERIDPEAPAIPSNMRMRNLTTPFYADLGLNFDWQVAQRCTVFIEGHNLANMNIYPWAFYREYGANFTVGAKFQF